MPEVPEKCRYNFSACLPTVYHSVHANVKVLATLPANSVCLRGGSVRPITHFNALLRFEECLELYLHFKISRHNVFKQRNCLGILLSSHCYQCPKETWSIIMAHTHTHKHTNTHTHTHTHTRNKQVSIQSVSLTLSGSKST